MRPDRAGGHRWLRFGFRLSRLGLRLKGPRIGQDQGIAARAAHQHQRARRIAVAVGDDPLKAGQLCPKGSERGGDIRAAGGELKILARAVTHPAPVKPQYRETGGRNLVSQFGLTAIGSAAQLVAAGHDQQPGAGLGQIERSGERFARAIKSEMLAVHAATPIATTAAKASACAASSPASARSHSIGPPISVCSITEMPGRWRGTSSPIWRSISPESE